LPTPTQAADDTVDLPVIAHRIEQLLEQVQTSASATLWSQIEELVRALTDLYGAGLIRTVDLAEQWVAEEGTGAAGGLLPRLAGDELVASLLVLHDAHPESLAVRAKRAVAAAPSSGGEVHLAGVESETGIVRVSVSAGSSGGGFDPVAVVDDLRQSLWAALPDASSIEVEVMVEPSPVATPVRLSRKKAPAGAGP
jgi:hypothetical protein